MILKITEVRKKKRNFKKATNSETPVRTITIRATMKTKQN